MAHVGQKTAFDFGGGLSGGQCRFKIPSDRFLFGDVADDAKKGAARIVNHLVDGKINGETAAILVLAFKFAPPADQDGLPCCQVMLYITVMGAAMGFWHQHPDVLADQLLFGVAEQVFDRCIDVKDGAVGVDMHHAVPHGAQNGAVARLAHVQGTDDIAQAVAHRADMGHEFANFVRAGRR